MASFSSLRSPVSALRSTGNSLLKAEQCLAKVILVSIIIKLVFGAFAHGQGSSAQTEIAANSGSSVSRAESCPRLSEYYSRAAAIALADDPLKLWQELAVDVKELMPNCLESSEYFALLGAAQLNGLGNPQAMESLERSLLLDPENGAARVDYAQALYNSGQLFSALEIGEELLTREGLPERLREELKDRNGRWLSEARQHAFYVDLTGGYGNNLNGAPSANEITLTLSGEPLMLALGNDYRAISGVYSNVNLSSQYQMLSPSSQRNWINEVKSRISGDDRSDLMQFESRYALAKPGRARSWRIDGGLTHLQFGGNSLFSSARASGRYQLNVGESCNPSIELAGQRQYFRQQSALDAIEGRLAAALTCNVRSNAMGEYSSVGLEMGLIHNHALQDARPGGNRSGWQATARWQSRAFSVQISHTKLDDSRSYSPILSDGADRRVRRNQILLQHRRPIQLGKVSATLLFNLFSQNQASNINLFTTDDMSAEVGLRFAF
jgi:hypothetical protein